MQKCDVCHTPFTWNQVSKSFWLAYKPIACPNCGRRYKVQFLSRILASLLLVGPIFASSFFPSQTNTQALLVAVLIVLPSVCIALPYLIRYRLV